MPVIDHLDIPAKRIYLAAGVRAYHPVDDLYREVRALRRTDDTLRVVQMPIVASGNIPKGQNKYTPRLVTFRHGWRVVPEDTSHTLNVTGEQITDDGQSGPACFDLSSIDPASKIIIQYEPPAAEVIVVETGGSSGVTDWTPAERAQILAALANLDDTISSRAEPGDAMTLTQAEREATAFQVLEEPLADHVSSIGSLGHEMGHVHDALIVRHGTVLAGSTAAVILTSITSGSSGIFNGLTLMVRGSERCSRIIKSFNGATGAFYVTLPFAFTPQPGDSVFVLAQRQSAVFGEVG